MARWLAHERYAALVTDQPTFAHEVSTLHRRVTSLSDTAGRLQVPWPRAVGTPPWAVARELGHLTGVPYAVHVAVARRGSTWPRLRDATAQHPAAVFVGDCFLPRHVVLVTGVDGTHAQTYEPASGLLLDISRGRWERGPLRLAGWDRPWLVVAPALNPGPQPMSSA